MTREQLVDDICDVIITHQLADGLTRCAACGSRELYGEGNGTTLSRHRAEKIADMLLAKGLVNLPFP